jgi:uncharacterized protein YdaU (DUF1376 family)
LTVRASEKPPAFQFYVKNWISSTKTMSLEDKGAHVEMMAWSWDNGPLPTSESKRARLLGLTLSAFRRVWAEIGDKWVPIDTGFVNLRLEQQRAELEARRVEQSNRGKKGADNRWHKHGVSIQQAVADSVLTDSSASASALTEDQDQNQDQDQTPAPRRRRVKRTEPAYTDAFKAFWSLYPRREKKPQAFAAWQEIGPNDALQAEIASALAWQVNQPKWHEDGGQYIPHPTTWLNNRRWEDEPFILPSNGYVPDLHTKTGRTMAAAKRVMDRLNSQPTKGLLTS